MKLLLTGKTFAVIATCITIGVFGVVSAAAYLTFLCAIPVLLVLIVLDLKSLPGNRQRCIVKIPEKLELDTTYQFRWQIALEGGGAQRVRFFAPDPDLIRFTKEELDLRATEKLDKGALFEFDVPGVCQRLGESKLPNAQMRVFSRMGFWTKLFQVEPQQYFRVYPSTEPIPEQEFTQQVNRQSSLFQGSRIMMRHRSADQFYSVRRYQYPDSFKSIDQKKSARYQKLMTRVYDTFQNHHLVIGLDVGRAMSGKIGASQKREFYLSAALNLAQNAINSGDLVSFFAFGQDIPMTIRGARSLVPFKPLHDGVDLLNVRGEESNYELMSAGVRSITSQRSIVVLMSDLTRPSVQNSVLQHLPFITEKHLTVLLSLVDRRYHVEDMLKVADSAKLKRDDMGQLIYGYWLEDQFRRFQLKASRAGGGVLVAPEKHWLDLTQKTYMLLRQSLMA